VLELNRGYVLKLNSFCVFVCFICLILQLWRTCSTLVARSRPSASAGTQVKTYAAKTKQDFPDDLDRSERPDELKSPVCSYNEWDPLEEVIVGRVEGAVKYIELQCIHTLLFLKGGDILSLKDWNRVFVTI